MPKRSIVVLTLVVVLLVTLGASAQTPTVTASQAAGDLAQAQQLTNQQKYAEAIAKAEAALEKLKILRDTPVGQPDVEIVSIFQQGETVNVVVKNNGTANFNKIGYGGTQYPNLDIQLYMVPAGGGVDVKWPSNGLLRIVGGLKPGETKTVSGGTFGCGTRQKIYAKIDPDSRIPETNEENNRSQTIDVVARSCSS